MYFSFDYPLFLISLVLLLINLHFSASSICSEFYPSDQQPCECEDLSTNNQPSVSLKCSAYSSLVPFKSDIIYRIIEFEFCSEDLNFSEKPLVNLTVHTIRIRHCNLIHFNDHSLVNLRQLEKFYVENSTIKSLSTNNGHFQEIFSTNSFQLLKSLTLKKVHYHQVHQHDRKLNLEILLQQLPHLYRLELTHIHLDNYRHTDIHSVGQDLTYLSLTNTQQTSLLAIEHLVSLERLLIRQLPEVFHSQPLIASLRKLTKLKYILFEQNQLKSIEHLRSESIDDIDLSSNLIPSIDGYTFEHVPKLRQLTLTGNPLNHIDKNAFCGIENLHRLTIHIKHRSISPLDNCILVNYPQLQISQDSQTKFQCNCQLRDIFHLKRQQTKEINRLFKSNQLCLYQNGTSSPRVIHVHELDHSLNCSTDGSAIKQCDQLCQTRTILKSSEIEISPKYTSLSPSLYSRLSYLPFVLLLAVFFLRFL